MSTQCRRQSKMQRHGFAWPLIRSGAGMMGSAPERPRPSCVGCTDLLCMCYRLPQSVYGLDIQLLSRSCHVSGDLSAAREMTPDVSVG